MGPGDREVRRLLKGLDDLPVEMPRVGRERFPSGMEAPDAVQPTAILCVEAYFGLGLHLVAALCRFFPGSFANHIFVSVAVPGRRSLGGDGGFGRPEEEIGGDLKRYVVRAREHDLRGAHRSASGDDVVPAFLEQCRDLA